MVSQVANSDMKRRIQSSGDQFKKQNPGISVIAMKDGSIATGSQPPSKSNDQTRANALNSTIVATILSPAILTSLFLIFGGCCSNVYALESIVKLSPASGTLVTFLQFVLTTLFTLPSQLTTRSSSRGSKTSLIPRLRKRAIPLHKWLIYTAFFLTINMLNNFVFSYRISIPLHIIVRSASPVTTMLVGYLLAGRRYTRRQVFAVLLLFAGVVLAALSDANSKVGDKPVIANHYSRRWTDGLIQAFKSSISNTGLADQLFGFILLFSALMLAAIMGIYTDRLYDQHGRSVEVTNENLFYSHMLSLPWFAFQRSKLHSEFTSLARNANSVQPSQFATSLVLFIATRFPKLVLSLPTSFLILANPAFVTVLGLLLLNALTQIVCITGVNRLSTETTSLTVTIVLNIRKLVSLLISIWLFGAHLSTGVVIGATMVFIGGALYGLGGKKTATKQKVG